MLLALLPAGPASAEAAAGFGTDLAAEIFATALAFLTPRTLEAVPLPEMTLWGLQGLAALDPDIAVTGGTAREVAAETPKPPAPPVRLVAPQRLLAVPAPDPADAVAWGRLAAEIAEAAYESSAAVRRAGTQGVVQSFFDELFNHLDPYSRYLPPGAAEADRARRAGQASVGLTVALRGTLIVVEDVLEGGPAAAAGVRSGDIIVAVDGTVVRARDPASVAALINGAEKTEVALTLRPPHGRTRTLRLVRALLPPQAVFADRQADLLVLRISLFNRGTGRRLAEMLDTYLNAERPPRGVVLDLRGNRGGLLSQAVDAAGLLLGTGLVATTEGRDPAANRILTADGTDLAPGLPLVVMVDGRSASAAEVLAASLADDGRAVVVGSATLGKGQVQTVTTLPDGGELFVTWSRVLAPRGWPIQGLGVMPQLCTSLGTEALGRAMAALAAGMAPMQAALARHHAARAPLPLAQMLEIRNACPAAEGTEADLRAARFLVENPVAYRAALITAGPATPP